MYLGLGLAGETKERVEKVASDIASQTRMTEEQGKEFANYLQTESQKARQELHNTMGEMIDTAMKHTPGLRRIQSLEKRIAELEKNAGIEVQEQEEQEENDQNSSNERS